MEIIITFISYFLFFAVVHSLLATDHIKNMARAHLWKRFYRIVYIIISVLTFAPAFLMWIKYSTSTPLVYSIPQWFYPAVVVIRLGALGMFAYAAFQTDILDFIGARQGKNALTTGGAYGIVRHPLYSSGIIHLLSKMEMSLLDITAVLLVSCYLVAGAFIEERRLISVFGDEYRKYRERVSMFIPVKWVVKAVSRK